MVNRSVVASSQLLVIPALESKIIYEKLKEYFFWPGVNVRQWMTEKLVTLLKVKD